MLYQHIVHPPTLFAHADIYAMTFEHTGERLKGELAPLVGVEYLRCSKAL
jgi:hypothetical protein